MRVVRLVSRVLVPALALGVLGVAFGSASCTASPTPVPVRSFNLPGKVAFMCLDVNTNAMNNTQLPVPLSAPESACPPVATGILGVNLAFHYFALVTQHASGELAVVDLTAGGIVDEDESTPGTNFIPVGAVPTDVVVAPVASVGQPAFTYVSSGDPRSYALYTLPNTRMLGDSTGSPRLPPLQLTDLMACRLPQAPIALAIVPNPASASSSGDGGAGEAPDASAPSTSSCQPNYAVAVLMQANDPQPAQIMVVDPTPMTCRTQSPGDLPPCTALGMTGSFASSIAGATSRPGATWADGVPYADGGDTSGLLGPMPATADAAPPAVVDAGAGGGTGGGDLDAEPSGDAALSAGSELDAAPPTVETVAGDGGPSLAVGPLFPPKPTAMVARDDAPVLYVADGEVPLIHVIDVSNPAAPVEVSSFIATSQVQPTRLVQIGSLALSPPTHSSDPVTGRSIRYLYAIDSNDGTLMVFDATNPIPPQFTPPLERPHAELNPFMPVDRLSFSAPVAAVTFVQHDWPLFPPNATNTIAGYTGLTCNPNPNTRVPAGSSTIPTNDPSRYGAYYATDQAGLIEPQGSGTESFPGRLRGVFGFVTLSNGNLVAIDVDDWDAPCRRPDPMDAFHQVGLLSLPQPAPTDLSDIDPYHAPSAHGSSVAYTTQETFFPVSAPNRMRSNYLLRNDPTSGDHEPYMPGPPQLLSSAGAPVAGIGQSQSILLPTALPDGFVDPAYYGVPTDPNDSYGSVSTPLGSADAEALSLEAGSPLFPAANTAASVRMSLDDPTAHQDQDWTVTYEGALPQVSPLVVNMGTTDGYQSLVLTVGGPAPDGGPSPSNAQFCAMGIEDWTQGQIRANAALSEMTRLGLPVPPLDPSVQLPRWTADYVEIVDDLVGPDDPYWKTGTTAPDGGPGYDCWEGTNAEAPEKSLDRYNLCLQTYGQLGENADSYLSRDFPIAEASDGSLVIGRFGYPGGSQGEQTNNRTVVGPDPSNVLFLKPAACCFHGQANVKIRTGGEWVTVGQNGLGLLHHVVPDPSTGRCVQSTVPHDQLLNARAFDVPFFDEAHGCATPFAAPPQIERTDVLAMRNPMFSYVMWGGCTPLLSPEHTSTARDLNWHFSLRGGFQPLTIQLGGGTLVPIVPQSMAFASAFQQLAIVDGSYQGLILIDLSALTFAHTPYF